MTAFLAKKCGVHTTGAPCGCHRQANTATKGGLVDPSRLDVQIGDLVQLRMKLAQLHVDERTPAVYQGDEVSELRAEILNSVRDTLFAMRH